jgi:hypothetical protein
MELATDSQAAAAFVRGIIPNDIEITDEDIAKAASGKSLPESTETN